MDSSEDSVDAFIPGVSIPGNRRPSRIRARKMQEIHPKIPVKQPLVENLTTDTYNTTSVSSSEEKSYTADKKQSRLLKPSLKDLRPEDKKRVANLIKELARVGDEREKAVDQLHEERNNFEKQLLTLVQQQEQILTEREEVQNRLFECQSLLTQYQGQLINKQDRLSTSLADMINVTEKSDKKSKPKVLGSPKQTNLPIIPETKSPTREKTPPNTTSPVKDVSPLGNLLPPDVDISSIKEEEEIKEGSSSEGYDSEVCEVLREEKLKSHDTPPDQFRLSHDTPPDEFRLSPKDLNTSLTERGTDCMFSDLDTSPLWEAKIKDVPTEHMTDHHQPLSGRSSSGGQGQRQGSGSLLTASSHMASDANRTYTSQIDQEIAIERRNSKGRLSPFSTPPKQSIDDGRPMFYSDRLAGIGPLQEPVMSSTHKSMEINQHAPQEFEPLIPDSSPRSSIRGASPASRESDSNRPSRSKVGFVERSEMDDEDIQLHSPTLKPGGNFLGNSEYARYYKKLSPGGRKGELLKQRQALVEEQERLKRILAEQEMQLQIKEEQYKEKKRLQQERMNFYKENGKFPFNSHGYEYRERENESRKDKFRDENHNEVVEREEKTKISRDSPIHIKSRVSASTSPRVSPRERISMATSPIRLSSNDSDIDSIPRLVDVATSISYNRSPFSEANRQGNLPFQSNRQRHSPSKTQISSPSHRSPGSARTPGEKTLSVVDIINSMDENVNINMNGSYIDTNTPERAKSATPSTGRSRTSPRTQPRTSPHTSPSVRSGYSRQYAPQMNSPVIGGAVDETDEEEQKILEDVFFLK